MSFGRLAASSLLVASVKSFFLPSSPTSLQLPYLASKKPRSSYGHHATTALVVGGSQGLLRPMLSRLDAEPENFDDMLDELIRPQRVSISSDSDSRDSPQPEPVAHDSVGGNELDALDDLLGLRQGSSTQAPWQDDFDEEDRPGNLDALDQILRLDPSIPEAPPAPYTGKISSNDGGEDNDFHDLDYLLGLEEPVSLLPLPVAGPGKQLPTPKTTIEESLDFLLDRSLPSAPEPPGAYEEYNPQLEDIKDLASNQVFEEKENSNKYNKVDGVLNSLVNDLIQKTDPDHTAEMLPSQAIPQGSGATAATLPSSLAAGVASTQGAGIESSAPNRLGGWDTWEARNKKGGADAWATGGKDSPSVRETSQRAVTRDIVALGHRGQWEDVVRVLVAARVRGLPINIFMYNSAISAISRSGRWKEALSIMKQMREDGLNFDEFTYSAAISACGKAGNAKKAVQLLNEMVKDHGLTPDIVCYGAACSACANAGMLKEVLGILKRVKSKGLFPDKTMYNSAIMACRDGGEWEEGLKILDEMRADLMRPNEASYRFAMEVCGKGGRWERALQLLEEMEEDGETPSLPAFQTVLDSLIDAGQWEKSMEVLEEMDECGIIPTEECFCSAIAACAEVGEWFTSCEAIKQMRDLRLQPSLKTYHFVLKACVRGKDYSRALMTFTDLKKSGKIPEQLTWDLVNEACVVCGRWECAMAILIEQIAELTWYDLDLISSRFLECPDNDIRQEVMALLTKEAQISAVKKRKTMNALRVAAKKNGTYVAVKDRPKVRKTKKAQKDVLLRSELGLEM